MLKSGPIIIVEDDDDDQFLIREALLELSWPHSSHFFPNGQEALDYLLVTHEQPFLIICDINMPIMNGLELREKIETNPFLKSKAVPFVFLSTSDNADLVITAYEGTIQGFFKKSIDFVDLTENLDLLIRYWSKCLHPNNTAGEQ